MPPPAWALEQAERQRQIAINAEKAIAERAREEREREAAEVERARKWRERAAEEERSAPSSSASGKKRTASGTIKGGSLPADWQSGEAELAEAQRRGRWADGTRVGKGHVRPYLMPEYARTVADGSKTIEGRPRTGWAALVKKDDFVNFTVSKSGGAKLAVRVTSVRSFDSFSAMLEEVGTAACLPGFGGGIEDAVRVYQSFGTSAGSYAELERSCGVVAVGVQTLAAPDDEPQDDALEEPAGEEPEVGATYT